MVKKTDYVAQAKKRLTTDNRRPNIEALAVAYATEAQALEDAWYPIFALLALP